VRPTFREVLVDSYVAAVAIAVLLLRSLESGGQALGRLLFHVPYFLVNAVAIRGIPYSSNTVALIDWSVSLGYLADATAALGAAWLVSRWVYGAGPLCSLSRCHVRLTRRDCV